MHDEETLEMAREILSPSVARVQVVLNCFWERYGRPPREMLDRL
jgi:hypothetical protein